MISNVPLSQRQRVPAARVPSIRRARAPPPVRGYGARRGDRLGEFLFALPGGSRQIRSVGISDFRTEIQSNTEKIQRERIFEQRSTEGLQRECVFGQTILHGLFG